jgi:hypothetical protein
MPTRSEFIKEVSSFFDAQKQLAGADMPLAWEPDTNPDERRIKIPISYQGQISGYNLEIKAYSGTGNLCFAILIVFHVCIARIDFDENDTHTNSFPLPGNLPSIIHGPHFHRWSDNIRFVEDYGKLPHMKCAEALPVKIKTFDAALRWFCDETRIDLPHGHQIQMPVGRLL